MNKVLSKVVWALFALVFYPIFNIIKFFIPYRLRSKTIKNEIALVTGAGNGIGREIAKNLAKEGATLVLWDVDVEGNNKTKADIEAAGGKAFAYKCDLTKKDEIYSLAKKVQGEVGDVTILVNNAGIVTGKKLLEVSDAGIERTFQVNTLAHFWTVRSFLPKMMEKDHGHIVTVASMAGLSGAAGLVDYCSSKFGAVGFDESLRQELIRLGKPGIITTVVCPTGINTGLFAGFELKGIPMMTPQYVAERVLEAVLTNQRVLLLPRQMYYNMFLKNVLPMEAGQAIGDLFEINNSMDNFTGRKKAD